MCYRCVIYYQISDTQENLSQSKYGNDFSIAASWFSENAGTTPEQCWFLFCVPWALPGLLIWKSELNVTEEQIK